MTNGDTLPIPKEDLPFDDDEEETKCICQAWFFCEIVPAPTPIIEIVGYELVSCPDCGKQWYVESKR